MFPLEQHAIFLTLAGSQAHGTAREGSDVDVRGVCIAPLPVRLSLFTSFEQYEGVLPGALAASVVPRIQEHPTAGRALGVKTECVIFDIAKFVSLCAAANPNALEILFADERDWLLATPVWQRLHAERHQFLTKKVQPTGQLQVRRDDAAELSAIRDGALSFDALLATAGELQQAMKVAATTSGLPGDVDYGRVDALLFEVLGMAT